jgi:transcriptional regulator with XRE-family HTH domain
LNLQRLRRNSSISQLRYAPRGRALLRSRGPWTRSRNTIGTGITAAQLRAARALLGLDQRALADAAQLSVPTIQRMEASDGIIRGTVDSLMKLVSALDTAGVELIGEDAISGGGGRGVRLKAASVPRRASPARPRNAA